MDPSEVKIPPMKDLNAENITENTILICNSNCSDERLKFLIERLVTHLHDFARETRLSMKEWSAAIEFLTRTGQKCTEERQEFALLSDILGLSILVDSIDHPKPPNSTEGSVLGPFHVDAAPVIPQGGYMTQDEAGSPCLVLGTVKDPTGRPIPDVVVDVWETDSTGQYDVQRPDRDGPDCRGIVISDAKGQFWFHAIRPVSYPVPFDGPVGDLLRLMHRHAYRPAHMHFMFQKPGYDNLVTALFFTPDPYITSDAVFGVKTSLTIEMGKVTPEIAKEYGVPEGYGLVKHDFVLATEEETQALRGRNATVEMAKLFPGRKVKLLDHLPVPDLD